MTSEAHVLFPASGPGKAVLSESPFHLKSLYIVVFPQIPQIRYDQTHELSVDGPVMVSDCVEVIYSQVLDSEKSEMASIQYLTSKELYNTVYPTVSLKNPRG